MGRICIVETCGNEYYPDCGLSFHRFPKDPNVRETWINIIPIKSTRKLNDASVVCSKHFKPQDFVPCLARPVLKCNAVPSFYLLPATSKIGVLCDQMSCSSKSDELVLSQEPSSKEICIKHEYIDETEDPLAEEPYEVEPESTVKLKDVSVQTDIKELQSEKLKRKVKILMQKLRRRNLKIQNLKKNIKRKCSDFDEL